MVTRLNVPPFVITLVTYTIAQGMALAITTGTPINGIDPLFSNLSQFYVGEVPVPALFFIGAAAIAWFVLERTYVGRQIYAVGGNKEAARLAGIPISAPHQRPPTSPARCFPASSAYWSSAG